MDFLLILKAAAALSVIGVVTAALLSVAARRFKVPVDERVEEVLSVLPGSNCGACGNPSCFSAAEVLATGDQPITLCTAGGQLVADQVAEILGVEKCEVLPAVSQRRCGGGSAAVRTFDYSGVQSCKAVSRTAGGNLACEWGCLGYGDCRVACPFAAIYMDARGLPVIDLDVCTGCEVCVSECPRGLLKMVAEEAPIAVRCSAHDKPRARKDACSMCCIACKRCEKVCPTGAIVVADLQAVVDYDACIACGQCVAVCPQKCIDLTGRFSEFTATLTDGKGPDVEGFVPEDVSTGQAES